MKNAEIQRLFIETMFKLRREKSYLFGLNIDVDLSKLNINLDENTNIDFSSIFNSWCVNSEFINSNTWNPKISEICNFLKHFKNEIIIESINKFNYISKQIFDNVSGESLYDKMQSILYLMTFIENINIKLKINQIEFYYDQDQMEYLYTFENNIQILNDEFIKQTLKDNSYNLIMNSFNEFYLKCKRKI